MKQVAIYIRVSTQEQAQEGYSIGEQKERLIAYCKAQAWAIYNIYVDGGYSGANINRPGIKKLIKEVANFDTVLVYKLDRLSRSQRDTLYLIEEIFLPNKVDFVSMQESFDTSSPLGKAMIGLLAVFAQLEREQIKERTYMGKIARAKSGLYHGSGHIPTGYNYKNGKLVINVYEAEQVKKIYQWYLDGLSLQAISERLFSEGYLSRNSDYKSCASIRSILGNITYTGRLHYDNVIVEHAHEAIITEEQFQAVQALRIKRQEIYGTNAFQSKHLLTGMIFCGKCGARYYRRDLGKYQYYSCYSRTKQIRKMVKDANCKNKNWRLENLESIVENRVCELLKSPEMAHEIAEKNRQKIVVVDTDNFETEKRIREIDKEINKFMELYRVDSIHPKILGENIKKLHNEKRCYKPNLKRLKKLLPLHLI